MEHTAVLDVYSISNTDGIDITTKDCAEPNAAFFSYFDVANDCCIVCYETIFTYFGGESSYRFYKCHKCIYILRYDFSLQCSGRLTEPFLLCFAQFGRE